MSNPMTHENLFLCYSIAMGIFITFVYDLLRIFRRVIRHNSFFVSLEDLLFWVFCALSVFALMYSMGNGNLRWFAVFGALGGMFVYLKTVSPWFVRILSGFLRKVTGVLLRIGRFIKKRLTALYKLLKIILCKQQQK